MPEDTYTTEHKELRIDTEEGLREFLQHTKDLYNGLVDAVEAQGTEAATAQLQQAAQAFNQACDVTEMGLHSLALGISLNDLLVSEIQDRYNDLATLHDLFVIEVAHEVEEEVFEKEEVVVPPTVILESSNTFVVAATTLAEKARVLLSRYEDLAVVPAEKDELSIARFYYGQLQGLAKEVTATTAAIEQQKPTLEISAALQASVTKTLEELDTKLNALDKELDRFFEPEVVPVVEKKDLSNEQASTESQKARSGRKSEFSAIVERVLLDRRYATFVEKRFHTKTQFELQLAREVARIEAPSKFDMFLGIRHESAFLFLKNMSLEEITAFDHAPRVVIRGELAAKDIPYELYVEWMYIISDIQSVLQAPLHISFGELFVRAELELMLREEVSV
jgi:hypothetical protein